MENPDQPNDVAMGEKTVNLVDEMLDLHRQLAGLSLVKPGAIDALVYRLYGLSGDEFRIVENG